MSSLFQRAPEVDASSVGDRVILYDRRSNSAITLNPSGATLWQHLEKPRRADELAAHLRQQFSSLDDAQAARDVAAFLEQLAQHQLVRAL